MASMISDAEATIRFGILDGISSRGRFTGDPEKMINAITLALADPSTRWALVAWAEELDEKEKEI